MRASYNTLMQSRFFTPAFNSAIFDGPVRIYFSQVHEALALKLYFGLQQKHADLMADSKTQSRYRGNSLLVMIYPTKESFQLSFEGRNELMIQDELSGDPLLGVNGPFDDSQLHVIIDHMANCLKSLNVTVAHREKDERPLEL